MVQMRQQLPDKLGLLFCLIASLLSLFAAATMNVVFQRGIVLRWQQVLIISLILLASFLLGFAWTSYRAQEELQATLPVTLDNTESAATFEISGYPQQSGEGVRASVKVMARVIEADQTGIPELVMVHWPRACLRGCSQMINPGQRWRARVRWRSTRTSLNWFSRDAQGRSLQQGILVQASIRGTPRLIGMTGNPSWQSRLSGLRLYLAERMSLGLKGLPWAGVLVALALGDQHRMTREQWEWFSRTGISHLVAISGTHVGLLAAMMGCAACHIARRVRIKVVRETEALPACLMEWVPTQIVFVTVGSIIALLYCLLAGWGIPAQRAFFTLLLTALMLLGRGRLAMSDRLATVVVMLTALDPWAVTTAGLWLSFGAVLALLVYVRAAMHVQVANGSPSDTVWRHYSHKLGHAFKALLKMQVAITLATAPLVAVLFHAVSTVSVPANLWAISWISFIVTPMALGLAVLASLPLPDKWLVAPAVIAHFFAEVALFPVAWLSSFDWAVLEMPAPPIGLVALSLLGVVLSLGLPTSVPRYLGWLLLLPQLLWSPSAPPLGGWRLVAFDIGQGSAVLVQTARHQILFDTGWGFAQSDAVNKHVLPELKAMGISRLDDVVISHPDQDHIGGLTTLEKTRQIGTLRGSGLYPRTYVACQAGQSWSYDEVVFKMIGPLSTCATRVLKGVERNQCSCVLTVTGRWHSALLPGDIDMTVERQLLGIHPERREQLSSRPKNRKTRRKNHSQGLSSDPQVNSRFLPDVLQEVKKGEDALGPVDVVLMAHHGSRSSSALEWVQALHPKHAISQSGIHNRFGHPHPEIEQRWRDEGAQVWSTARDGAVVVESTAQGLLLQNAREHRKRYWHVAPDATLPVN